MIQLSKNNQISVIQYGLGPIGCELAKLVLDKKNLKLVGGIDVDKSKVGKDLGLVIDYNKQLGIPVVNNLDEAIKIHKPDIILHATQSHLKNIKNQILDIIQHGINLISTAEELSYPWINNKEIANKIDSESKQFGVSVLGAGVNPGYILDAMVVALTGVSLEVDNIVATRVVDASKRRLPFQKKIGAGLSKQDFDSKLESGMFGHIGLIESLQIINNILGFKLTNITNVIKPVIANKKIITDSMTIEKNQVLGLNQIVTGKIRDETKIKLILEMYVGAQNPYDEISVNGQPNLTMHFKHGVHGDIATRAIIVNSISRVLDSNPGLHIVTDLPMAGVLNNN
jgi:4-hydroxy-tetrahydrodipicolinate reductase